MGLCVSRSRGFSGELGEDVIKGCLLCHDPFTAAVFSGSKEMVKYIGGVLGDIPWSDSLEKSIAYSGEEMQEYLLECYPEMIDYLRMSVILEVKSRKLLDAVMKRRREDGVMWKELYDFLKNDTEQKNGRGYKRRMEKMREMEWECPASPREELLFLKQLFDCVPNDEIRNMLQNFVLQEGFVCEDDQRAGMLLQLFSKAGDAEARDHTEILRRICTSGKVHWERFGKLAKAGRIGIDLYAEHAEDLRFSIKEWGGKMDVFLGAVRPLAIRDEADAYTQSIIDTNQIRNVKQAVKEGLITPGNALALYEYAAEGERPNESILAVLVRLAQKEDRKARYTGSSGSKETDSAGR